LWTAQKVALQALLAAVRGPFTIQALLQMPSGAHKSFANAPRKRKPHVIDPIRTLF